MMHRRHGMSRILQAAAAAPLHASVTPAPPPHLTLVAIMIGIMIGPVQHPSLHVRVPGRGDPLQPGRAPQGHGVQGEAGGHASGGHVHAHWQQRLTHCSPPACHLSPPLQDKGGRALVLIPLKQKGDRVKTGDTVETPSLTRALATQTQVDFRLYALPEKIPECIPGVPGRRWTVLQEGVTSTGDNPHVRDLQRACLITVPFAPGASSNCKLRLQFGGAAIIAQAIDESTGKTVESAIKY